MPTLQEKQSGMKLRQKPRPGRKALAGEGQSPAGEARIRVAMYLSFMAGQDLDQIARQFDRPRAWLASWFQQDCPLM